MVPRIRTRRRKSAVVPGRRTRISTVRRIIFETSIFLIVGGLFGLKILNYVDPGVLLPSSVSRTISTSAARLVSAVKNLPLFNRCTGRLRRVDVPGGFVCAPPDLPRNPFDVIYTSYPLTGQNRETIYSSTDEGSISAANDLLHGKFDVSRYRPVRLRPLPEWSENPYHAKYWRFEFYSLQPSLNLLYAYRTTGRPAYARQLTRLDLSFVKAEPRSRWAWTDPRTVAFRSMSLVDTWWKLREYHQLSAPASSAILRELEKTGQFLAFPGHYQAGGNYAADEAAGLYELAVAFPTLPHAGQWLAVAVQRFRWQLEQMVDADGQLIENSPYYDFSILQRYWQIYQYSLAQRHPISRNFGSRLRSMINFATYILQPNSQIPLIGTSVEKTIRDSGVFSGMAAEDPAFRYVVTQGEQGTPPAKKSVYFPASALSIMRSGWAGGAGAGSGGRATAFDQSTYLTFYAGKFRTADSDLDALDLTLYGDGGDLLTDPGLYTDTPGRYRDYFHGTMSHNTVVVDGMSQSEGNGSAEPLQVRDGLTYQSAESSLYGGVTHRRMVMMIDPHHILVVDRLSSARVHTYQQMFHLFPGAKLARSGLTVSGKGGTPRREITIRQLVTAGITETSEINQRGSQPDGLCSRQYGKLLPCYAVSYDTKASNATFVTLLSIGDPRRRGFAIAPVDDGQRVRITDGPRHLLVSLSETTAVAPTARAAAPAPPAVTATPAPAAAIPGDWFAEGAGLLSYDGPDGGSGDGAVVSLSTNSGRPAMMLDDSVRLDLGKENARLRLMVTGLSGVAELRLRLSNDHWAKSAAANLLDTYGKANDGHWASVFLGPGGPWGSDGGWQESSPGFSWSQIDGLEIEITTIKTGGPAATVTMGGLDLIPPQNEGKLVFVFDGDSQTIVPAVSYLRRNGMPGDVGVIGEDVDYPTEGYLNEAQLGQLQNGEGWDIVNETQQGAEAVRQYSASGNVAAYGADIVTQAAWLEANKLDSAPNWLIDPDDSMNARLADVVASFYKFAEITADGADAYPYGDPTGVTGLQVAYPGDGEGQRGPITSPAEILSAVRQALTWHMTLILNFNRIYSEQGDPAGYPIGLFKQIVNGVRQSGIKVMTLSELDSSNGVAPTNHISVSAGHPSQISVQISASP